jgi:hypothetical protein
LRRIHETFEDIRNIKKKELRIHSRKETSEDRFEKGRSKWLVPQKKVRGFLGLVNYY